MKTFAHILVLAAFILAGISPACAFISGQEQTIEICTFDGIKMVKVPAEDQNHVSKPKCPFCLFQSNIKLAKSAPPDIILVSNSYSDFSSFASDVSSARHELSSISLRGPPSFLS